LYKIKDVVKKGTRNPNTHAAHQLSQKHILQTGGNQHPSRNQFYHQAESIGEFQKQNRQTSAKSE